MRECGRSVPDRNALAGRASAGAALSEQMTWQLLGSGKRWRNALIPTGQDRGGLGESLCVLSDGAGTRVRPSCESSGPWGSCFASDCESAGRWDVVRATACGRSSREARQRDRDVRLNG